MTRSTDPRSAIGDLPSFLGAPDRPAHDTDAQRSESEAPEATEEFFDEAEDGYEERGDEDYEDEAYEEVGDDEQADYDAGAPVSARARRRRDPSAVPSAGGVAALAAAVGADPADCWPILLHLAVNRSDVRCTRRESPADAAFSRG